MRLWEKRLSKKVMQVWGILLLTLLLLSSSACHLFRKDEIPLSAATPLLKQNAAPTGTVGLELFTIRITPQQQEQVRQLWSETDEQRLPPELRRRLIDNGIRVGFLGDVLTPSLSQLINVSGKESNDNSAASKDDFGQFQEIAVANIPRQLPVTRQYRNLLPNMQAHLKMFDESLPEFSFLEWKQGCLSGKTYSDVLGLICLSCTAEKNGAARLTILPELEYGVPERKTVIVQGVYMLEEGRPRRKFQELAVTQDLLPGQWLILGPVSEHSTGLGRAFFFRGTENAEQRLLAVRLLNVKAGTENTNTLPVPERKTDLPFQDR